MKINTLHKIFRGRIPQIVSACAVFVLLAACASYQQLPLTESAKSATGLDDLLQPHNIADEANKTSYKVDLSNGLNLTETAILAVLNNDNLKQQRLGLNIYQAQVIEAGLLPEPQFNLTQDKPTATDPSLSNAWAAGIDFSVWELFTRSAKKQAAVYSNQQAQLNLRWQEWQTAQQAKLLAVQFQTELQKIALINEMLSIQKARYSHSSTELAKHNTTIDSNGADLVSLADSESALFDLQKMHNSTSFDIRKLFGLDYKAKLNFEALPPPPEFSNISDQQLLNHILTSRPDLLALKAGYQSQEESVRQEILKQFPALNIGFNRASDTGRVLTSGLSLSFQLPLFNQNRGNIALARASRQYLKQDYENRIRSSINEIHSLIAQQKLLQNQLKSVSNILPSLKSLLDKHQLAFKRRQISRLSLLNIETTYMTKMLEKISVIEALWKTSIALQTLTTTPDSVLSSALLNTSLE